MTPAETQQDDAPAHTAKEAAVAGAAGERDEGKVLGRTETINRPRAEVFAFFRDFANLPRVMENIDAIETIDSTRSRWRVHAPGGRTVEWEAVVTREEPDRLIAWESIEGADIRNSGRVEFRDAPPGRGTEVTAVIGFDPPGGAIGRLVAKLTHREPGIQERRDLRRLRQYLETGEIATSSPPNPPPKA